MQFNTLLALAASISTASAQYKGFNYGSTFTDGSAKQTADFAAEFSAASKLAGTTGFNAARLYTMIQANTPNTPIAAIQAAIDTDTKLLLGLWASAGQESFTNEIAALNAAISQYGSAFTSRVIGISIGSEDLYRVSATGIANKAGIGAGPDVIVSYINQAKLALASTPLKGAKITHVDTFNAWTNGTNAAVVDAVDFLSMDAYPYFQKEMANSIENGASLFKSAYDQTVSASKGKDVWITETGWPVSGPESGAAVANVANAKTFWDEIGCGFAFGKINTFWYTLQDAEPTTPSPSFGIVAAGPVSGAPVFDLTCPLVSASSSSASAGATVSPQQNVLAVGDESASVLATSSAAAIVSAAVSSSAARAAFFTSAVSSSSIASSSTVHTSARASSSAVAAAAGSGRGSTSSAAAARSSSSSTTVPANNSGSALTNSLVALFAVFAGVAAIL